MQPVRLTPLLFAALVLTLCLSSLLGPCNQVSAADASVDGGGAWINQDVSTLLDLASVPIVRVKTTVVIKVSASSPQKFYFLTLPPSNSTLAHLSVTQKSSGADAVPIQHLGTHPIHECHVYKVTLQNAVEPGQTTDLVITAVYTDGLIVSPAVLPQDSTKQYLQYYGTVFWTSRYSSEAQKLSVRLPTHDVLSYSDSPVPVKKSGSTINYGPYLKVAPYLKTPLHIHFLFPHGMLAIHSMKKTMEISHWGSSLSVAEEYQVEHIGAKLKGYFSRIELQKSAHQGKQSIMINSITASLPARSSNIFYRDIVGNVSTSSIKEERSRVSLMLIPRFPMYGGWKTAWSHGFDVPLQPYVKIDRKQGKYVVNLPFLSTIAEVAVQKQEVVVILPEGAYDVQFYTPCALDKASSYVTYSYLDSVGRPTLSLSKSNVVPESGKFMQVSYRLPIKSLIIKPLAVAAVIFALFLAFMLGSRLDMTIVKSVEQKELEAQLITKRNITKLVDAESRLVKQLLDAFETFKADRDIGKLRDMQNVVEASVKIGRSRLATLIKPDTILAKTVAQLQAKLERRVSVIQGAHAQVISFYLDAANMKDEKQKESAKNALEKLAKELQELDGAIASMVEKI